MDMIKNENEAVNNKSVNDKSVNDEPIKIEDAELDLAELSGNVHVLKMGDEESMPALADLLSEIFGGPLSSLLSRNKSVITEVDEDWGTNVFYTKENLEQRALKNVWMTLNEYGDLSSYNEVPTCPDRIAAHEYAAKLIATHGEDKMRDFLSGISMCNTILEGSLSVVMSDNFHAMKDLFFELCEQLTGMHTAEGRRRYVQQIEQLKKEGKTVADIVID